MSLSSFSIRRPVFAWMLFAAALLFGLISASRLGVSQLPDVDFPVVHVNFNLVGASPEVMENDVVDVAEEALMSVEGMREIRSSSSQGSASITLEFALGRDLDAVVQDVQTKLGQIARRLPNDLDPPSISKTNPEDQPIMWLAVTAPEGASTKDLMLLVRDQLRAEFQTVPGVGEITLGGWVDRNLRVWLKADRLAALQLSADDIVNAVDREHLELPAGRIEGAQAELNVRFLGEANTVKAFEDLPITARGGSPVFRRLKLKDVTRLEDGLDDIRRISRFNGKAAVGIGIRKLRGVNAVAVGKAVKVKMQQVIKTLPQGYDLKISVDNTKFVEEAVRELWQTLILSALLTAFVCWLFLGSLASTFNVLLSIPFSIVGTFTALHFLGFTLNTFTLLALSLSVGVVVDDAIMVLENIVRHKEGGKTRLQASLDGAGEITFAAMAATFSIVAIFLPVAFMDGIIGRYFYQFGLTISVAALLSLIEALTLTPMRTSIFLEEQHQVGMVDKIFSRGKEQYRKALQWTLQHRLIVLGISGAIFLVGFWAASRLSKEMIPAQDQSRVLVRLSLPTGTTLETTDGVTRKAEEWLLARGEVDRYYAAVGGFGGGDVSTAVLFVSLKNKGERPVVEEFLPKPGGKPAGDAKAGTVTAKTTVQLPQGSKVKKRLSQSEFAAVARREISKFAPKMRVSIQDLSQRGFSTGRGYPVEFTVRGPDWETLVAKAEELRNAMKQSLKLADVDSDYVLGQREIRVMPDRDAAALRGVSMQSLGNVIGILVGGKRAGRFSQSGRRNDIKVRLEGAERSKPEDILKLSVRNNRGELVRLADVVKLDNQPSLQAIRRVNRERAITVYGNAGLGVSGQDALNEAMRLAKQILPDGYRALPTGASQAANQSSNQLWFALMLGVGVAYMILASQFNSFVHPITVLMAMPFSFTGAFLALLAAPMLGLGVQTLNIYSFIGLILLMGLVKKNSILLVDVTNQFREKGAGADAALLEASPLRLRPILMTSVATIAGALPAALSLGAGAETLRPMGLTIVGGMLLSTFLTLFVVPSVYSLFAQILEKKKALPATQSQKPPRARKKS